MYQGADSGSRRLRSKGCKYCAANSNDWYPTMKFKVSSKDLFRKTAIIVEMNEKLPKKLQKKSFRPVLPLDYWDFIPKDPQQEENCLNPNRRVLSHAQVHYLLKDIDPGFIKEFVSRMDSFFLNCLPVTPNNHRVTEITHALSNGQTLIFDQHSRAYKKLVDFRGTANELSCRVLDCLKTSKASNLRSEKSTSKDSASKMSGLKWIKEVLLGKRTNHSFRMIVVGDPKLRLSEIGIPCHIAEELLISEHLNSWNWEKVTNGCNLRLLEKGQTYVRRKGTLAPASINSSTLGYCFICQGPSFKLSCFYKPALLFTFSRDFDGDCLHGYIPQSVDSRVELSELVALNRQLINRQSGRNLLSLSQDSLSAAHLVMEDGVLLNLFQMQQLEMFCPYQLQSPAIIKAPLLDTQVWTGKQLFSMLLPPGFNYVFPLNGVRISDGELISSSDGSAWLRDIDGNLFSSLVKDCQGKALDFLYAAQEVLCEWLSMRGLSVSLSDIYLSSDSISRKNMIDEVFCGLLVAEQTCHFKQLLVDSSQNFLIGSGENNQNGVVPDVQSLWYERQGSAALCQSSVCAFKQKFRDIQNLVYQYANKDNSLLAMLKAGSKGNLLKLVQQGLCLGLQHSLVPLSFKIPHQLSCAAWNKQKVPGLIQNDTSEYAESYIPYAVVENSFLMGLNPLECFVHSVTSRDSSFSDNADLPGTLTRRLMFFMRDLYIAYDGTVRNAYGNQLVQFSYNIEHTSTPSDGINEDTCAYDMGGQPVGSISACAISEAAYSALDQPISLLEPSPLLNLKVLSLSLSFSLSSILSSGIPLFIVVGTI
ncbi:DNA-directed RNA polymerase IV subunit 1 [Vitis vinifera]|uniref:DNA-directed RNA polymerase n=1 Tax=Vitis vinifera TaxID=29760 RepID=A0A438JJC7_VITVI|nr:DNA-directed RNA polymerase IV subunit 1 [Vitis vinifera]